MQYPVLVDSVFSSSNGLLNQYILATDLEGNLSYCNDAFIQLYSLVGTLIKGIPIESIFNSRETELFKTALLRCKQNKLLTEKILLKKPGTQSAIETILFTMNAALDKKGFMVGVIVKGEEADFSAQKKSINSNAPIRFSAQKPSGNGFMEMANYMPDLMWLTNKDHEIIQVNQAWLNFCGTSHEDELDNKWLKQIHPEDLEKIMDERKRAYLKQHSYSLIYRFRKQDGSYRWMNMKGNPVYNQEGSFLGYTGISLDITPVKEAQIQIKRQQELMESTKIEFGKFTKIAQKIGSIIIMCNADNKVTWVNDAFVKTSGYALKEISGKTPGSFLKGPETSKDTLDRIKKVIEQGKGIRTEILYYTKTGTKIWLDLMIETLFDKDGVVSGYITIQKDITLKKISEKEVLEQMSHLKKISFITSHELRHEFSKILQLLQTAKFQDHNVTTYAQIFADIEHSANLMNDAIFKLNDQINFASSNSISLNKYLLNQAIEEICLVDDDHLVNKLNELIIRNVMPSMPVHTFDHVDTALQYVKENPNIKRKIFLDLNFSGRSGWDFLFEYEKLGQPWPIVVLTSSIDHVDYERSKKFSNVTHFITKPLTIEQFEKLSEMENLLVH